MGVRIGELADLLPQATLSGNPGVEINGIAYDSRQVQSGDLFVCIKGFNFDGHTFAEDALARGAVGLVVEQSSSVAPPSAEVPIIHTEDSRKALALLSAEFYGHPSRKLRLIGVTGTNGKTTTTYLIKAILAAAGHKVGLIGGIGNQVGGKLLPAERTTPESLDLQRLFNEMVIDGCDYSVMEVSSHAIELQRIAGSEFDIGVFTNLSQDHLDFHPSLQDYFETKARFFTALNAASTKDGKAAILNSDDQHSADIARQLSVPIMSYGTTPGATYRAEDIQIRPTGLSYRLVCPQGDFVVRLPITGYFNVYNSLAALATCVAAGLDLTQVIEGLAQAQAVPGRLEGIDVGQDFTVLVDYAHTPDSLENALKTVRGLTKGRTIVVFGCGGDRDKTKRPLMGEIAGRLADVVIVTSDNPRSEDPEAICEAVAHGLGRTIGDKPFEVIVDRRQAIERAVEVANKGDSVLIAGKGHETDQVLRDRTIHFDDREEAARALKERLEIT
jgi:UDP-N-acetylmuramoyl-L-alanyl-D-glutamate--2,6-diaminopimelate ligase